jgi:hypothetical protein
MHTSERSRVRLGHSDLVGADLLFWIAWPRNFIVTSVLDGLRCPSRRRQLHTRLHFRQEKMWLGVLLRLPLEPLTLSAAFCGCFCHRNEIAN